MTEPENRIESETAAQPSVPMWIWGVTVFVACYAIVQLQNFA